MAAAFVLDRASILDRLGGDEEIYAMMVDMFLDDVEGNCTAIAAAFSGGDIKALQREAHTIKGLLATFSDDAGAAEALSVEKSAQAGELACQYIGKGHLFIDTRSRWNPSIRTYCHYGVVMATEAGIGWLAKKLGVQITNMSKEAAA